MRHFGNDLQVVVADETPWPTHAAVISEGTGERAVRDGWGRVQRTRSGAQMSQLLEVGVPERVDPGTIVFDDPLMDTEYAGRLDDALREELFLFCKG